MGVGAYTAAVLGGESGGRTWGLGLPMWVWLPAAGIGAALVGLLIGPAAVRVRGLYLGIVTIGLVFIGIHLSRVLPGDLRPGRDRPRLPAARVQLVEGGPPVISFEEDGHWLWFDITGEQKSYLFMLAMLGVAIVVAKNLVRTRTGRALQAIRDRDVAAEIMGVPEVRYKLIAFAISSFFAGVAGALFASFVGRLPPEYWSLILAVEFIAIILIGGAGTIAGAMLGTFFVVLLPQNLENFVHWMSEQAAGTGLWAAFWDIFVSSGTGDFGFVSDAQIAPGFPLPSGALDAVLYGTPRDHLLAVRAARAVRHLGQGPQLLEGLALHVLMSTRPPPPNHTTTTPPTRHGGHMKKKWLSAAFAASLVVAAAGHRRRRHRHHRADGTEPAGTEPAGTEPRARKLRRRRSRPRSPPTSASPRTPSRVGMLADLSGAFAPLVSEIVEAQQVYWDAVNRDGGIAGRQIELVIEDNAYDVPTQLEKYEIDPRQRGDHQPVDRVAALGGDRRRPRRGRPRRHPAELVLGVARSGLRAEPAGELHDLLHRVDERHRVVAQQPRRADRRPDLVPRRVRR